MRITLISPPREVPQPADFPPMGLLYIGAVLKEHGFEVKIIDAASMSFRRLKKEMQAFPADMVGVTCWTVERGMAYRAARLARAVLPRAVIVLGGHHASAFPEHLFSLAEADVICVGQGEETMLELAEHHAGRGLPLKEIRGIVYKEEGQTVHTPLRPFDKDLDKLPFPDYDGFDLRRYNGLPEIEGPTAALITSRGCPYACTFCAAAKFWERKWLYRTPQNVLAEIDLLMERYPLKGLFFFDDVFALKKARALEICKGMVERGYNLKWAAELNIRSVDEELLYWMKKSGCYRVDFGVESGSPKILANIKKPQKVEHIRRAFVLCHKAGVEPRAYLMVGNPGEDESTIDETVALMKELDPYLTPTGQILWILPNTDIYHLAVSQGVIDERFWLTNNEMVYYTGERSVKELRRLRDRLMRGLARNQGTIRAYLGYLFLKLYYRSPFTKRFYHRVLARTTALFNYVQAKDWNN